MLYRKFPKRNKCNTSEEAKSLHLQKPKKKPKKKQECIPVGCVPPACDPYLPACTSPGGVPGPGGCTWSWGKGGVPGPGGGTWSGVGGGVPGPRGCTWSQGVYLIPGWCTWSGGCTWSQGGVPGPGGCTWSQGSVPAQVPPRTESQTPVKI